MSLFFRKPETRAITSVPWNVGAPLHSAVSESRALRLAPVFSSVRLLSDTVSTVPVKAYRNSGDARVPMPSLPQMFATMKNAGTLVPWLGSAVMSLAVRGNSVGMITHTDGFGFPTNITWVSMDRVQVDDSTGVGQWFIDGRPVSRLDIVHIPWVTVPGRTLGLSPIEAFAHTVDAGLSAQEYGSGWFDNGGVPPGTFKNEAKVLPPDAADKISDRLVSAIKRRRPLVHGRDWTFTPISIPPNEAQFIETQKLTATQIASIYGIPPEMIGGESGSSMTYANVEQQMLNFVTLSLRPWLVKLEHAFSSWLPDKQYVKLNADALVRSDLLTRHEVHEISRRIGLRNIDEIRALEELPPLPNGEGKQYTAPAPEQDPGQEEPAQRRLSVIHQEAQNEQ